MRRPSRLASLALAPFASLLLAGCNVTFEAGEVSSIYVVPASVDELTEARFFDHPWPSDLRLEGGSPRIKGYYNPRQIPILNYYIDSLSGVLDGFSPAAAGYVRFDGAIDPASLPADPKAALDPNASVQLIDIDPASPEHGRRRLVSLSWREAQGVYYEPNTLAFMPTIGFPLRTHTRYALVVTDALRGKNGGTVTPSVDLRAALDIDGGDERTDGAKAALAPAVSEIEAAGVGREHIVHLAVFTTADPTRELFEVRDDVLATVPPPVAAPDGWVVKTKQTTYTEYVGEYGPTPNYQAGKLPFESYGDGGQFNYVDGHPQVVDFFTLRFSLTVPKTDKCPMPPEGYPIVLYAHGTGGNYRSYVQDGTGDALAQKCVASMGIDQIFHGKRPGAPMPVDEGKVELLFFNFQNPIAARTNPRQSAIDEVQRARLFTESHLTVPKSVSINEQEIRFDASKLMFFGHSQGGLNGPLYLAADGSARGGVLSGSSSMMSITLLEKTQPEPSVAALVKTVFLGLKSDEEGELDVFHPAMSLAQSLVDVTDPIHYARHTILEPRPGFASKSVYMTEGIGADGVGDSYAPPHGIEAQGLAMGLPLQMPSQWPIAEARWGGPGTVEIPAEGLSGNLAGGAASGVLAQWAPNGSDGHFVVFDVEGARWQAAQFCRNLADDPKGRVPAP